MNRASDTCFPIARGTVPPRESPIEPFVILPDGLIIERTFLLFIFSFFRKFPHRKKEESSARSSNFAGIYSCETVLLYQGRAPRVFRELPNPVTAITRTCSAACTLHVSPRLGTGSRERDGRDGIRSTDTFRRSARPCNRRCLT